MTPLITRLALLIAALSLTVTAFAQDYQGATSVLRALSTARTAPAPDPAADPAGALRHDMEAYGAGSAAMPPAEAGRAWAALADRYLKLGVGMPQADNSLPEGMEFQALVTVLPPPPAWPALAAAVEARRPTGAKPSAADLSLRLLAHLLVGDTAAQWKDLAALEALAATLKADERGSLIAALSQISDTLTSQSGDPARIIKGVELALAARRAAAAVSPGSETELALPDLVTLIGPQRAEALLRRALLTPGVEITVPSGDATLRLAQRLALELVNQLPAPQWSLAHSITATRLYEAMDRRFPSQKAAAPKTQMERLRARYSGAGRSRQTAEVYYLMGLIAAGRTQDAAAFATRAQGQLTLSTFHDEAYDELERAGYTRALHSFLKTVLASHPNLPFWDAYIATAAKVGASDEVVTQLRAAMSRKDVSQDTQTQLRRRLYAALLAANRVDEGVTVIRQILAGPATRDDFKVTLGMQLARIGWLLQKPEWVEEGLKAARAGLGASAQSSYPATSLVSLLLDMDRGAEAEQVLIAALRAKARRQTPDSPPDIQDELVQLAGVYHLAGRHQDVLALLDGSPDWRVKDLREVLTLNGPREVPLGHMAAAALAATGRSVEAVRILTALLYQRNDFDPAYELLVDLRGSEALPLLDDLYRRDAFEERPLIWKAEVLRRVGRLDEAEAAARAAIAVDPSDGEQHYGRRMRVYAVLADIRAARGDASQGTLLRGAVQAIRISEHADEFYQAGLLQRGIGLYKEALTHFADAYCIQSRLAVQLASEGRNEEAEAHYRRAYELMPDSFGRMETHCFGCERVFAGKRAETMAERIFSELAVKTPEKPQVHYLLGYLREEQGRFPEALQHYRTAVRLDPDYLNAWKHIYSVGQHMRLPEADRSAATLNLLRLDPQQRHGGVSLAELGNLRAVWEGIAAAQQLQAPPSGGPLYRLRASAAVLEKAGADPNDEARVAMAHGFNRYSRFSPYGSGMPDSPLPTPAEAIAQQRVVMLLGGIIQEDVIRRMSQPSRFRPNF
jgi:tetratricopeptide (TPR) repeat protein